VDPTDHEAGTEAIRRLNDRVRDDPRVESVMIPVADGLTVARKRSDGPQSRS
jgi:predicted O-methyltransferase YrrM